MNTPLIRIKNLSIATKTKKIIHEVSFHINPREVFALVGESGSGKSLTALALIDLLPSGLHKSGDIYYQNTNLARLKNIQSFRGAQMAFIFQDPGHSLNPVMNVGNQVDEVLKLHTKLSKKHRKQRVLDLFSQVGLGAEQNWFERYPHQLSGGQKQRVMIASALAGGAKLLIADEITTALDVQTQKYILELLQVLKQTHDLSILLITHDLAVVKLMADRVAVMHRGTIIEQQSKADFFANPQQAYSKKLLTVLPRGKRTKTHAKTLLAGRQIKVHFPIKTGFFQRTTGYVKSVDGVNFEIKQGQNLAIVGESGSGKTTLAKAIMRQLTPSSGILKLNNQPISQYSRVDYAKQVPIIFQNVRSSFNPRTLIVSTLLEGLHALNPAQANLDTIRSLLSAVELDAELMYRHPHELSGGQLQRLAIARALSVNPKIIICDEPTSSLDATVKRQILNLLLKLQRERGVSYLMITHDISIVDYFADEVLVMKNGKVLESGASAQVLSHPKNPYTKALLASVLT